MANVNRAELMNEVCAMCCINRDESTTPDYFTLDELMKLLVFVRLLKKQVDQMRKALIGEPNDADRR